jgi:superfamily II DNA or RNA helicase
LHARVHRHAWRTGDRLLVRGGVWSVLERSEYAGCEALRLRSAGSGTPALRTILLPFDRPQLLADRESTRVIRARAWLRHLRAMTADARPAGGFCDAAAGSISILPYQLEPALLMRRDGTRRVMIADGVGLGKTIQAGWLLAELAAEHEAFRALVVVPAGLRAQWTEELVSRFGIEAITATSPWLARAASDLPADVNPWGLPGVYLASFDLIKRPEVLRPLEDVTWDALVVDEAHEASAGTARRAAIHAVACRARRVILLTATPHAGDVHQFAALCRIGAHAVQSPPIVMFRRTHSDVAPVPRRRTTLLAVRLSSHERRMHRLLEAYTRRLCDEARARADREARLVAIVLRKRALSSAASLAASCLRRLALLDEATPAAPEHQLSLPLGDEELLPDAAPDAVLGGRGLGDVRHERSLLAAIAGAARRASAAESKIAFLKRMFARIAEPAIVFTEYRDTLDRLRRELLRVRSDLQVLHGGMDLGDRADAQEAFNTRSSLLIATDAASEGLNLHARCRLVIHFELPWSPVRLEQRTGRVDRIGQSRRVHEVLLVANDTAERMVLAPLLARATRSRSSLPQASAPEDVLTESQVAAALLEGIDLPAAASPAETPSFQSPPADLHAEAVAEATRLMGLRRSHVATERACPPGRRPLGVVATSIRHARGLTPGIVAIFDVTLATPDGTAAHRELAAAHCEAAYAPPKTHADVRAIVSLFRAETEAMARGLLAERCTARLGRIASRWREAAATAAARERGILASLPSTATQLVQAGLFDQRAIRASTTRSHASALLVEEAARRIDASTTEAHLSMSVGLRAVLVIAGRCG